MASTLAGHGRWVAFPFTERKIGPGCTDVPGGGPGRADDGQANERDGPDGGHPEGREEEEATVDTLPQPPLKRQGPAIVIWEWALDRQVVVNLPAMKRSEKDRDAVAFVHAVLADKSLDNKDKGDGEFTDCELIVVQTGERVGHVFRASNDRCRELVSESKSFPLPACSEQDPQEMWRRLKLCGPGEIHDEPTLNRPIDTSIVDCVRISSWSSIGVTNSHVVLIKNGAIMFTSDDWQKEGENINDNEGQPVDPERLVAVATAGEVVCAGSDFGNIYVLDKQTLALKETLPLGVPIVSLCMPKANGTVLGVASENKAGEDAYHIVDLEDASFVTFSPHPGLCERHIAGNSATDLSGHVHIKTCPSCGEQSGKCVLATSRLYWACRSRSSGCTRAKLKKSGKHFIVVQKSPQTTCSRLYFVGSCLITCDDTPNSISIFVLEGAKAHLLERVLLDGPCVSFDVDFQLKNRIVALAACDPPQVSIFKFPRSTTKSAKARLLWNIILDDCDSPRRIAAHDGKIAVADDTSVVVLMKPAKLGDVVEQEHYSLASNEGQITDLAFCGPHALDLGVKTIGLATAL